MIFAEIFTQDDGKIRGFKINGHSNTAPKGFDIYCAGISALSQSAFLCIVNHLRREITGDSADGHLVLKLKQPADDLTEAAFQTMLIGMREIEKIAPQAFKLKITSDSETKDFSVPSASAQITLMSNFGFPENNS